MTEDAALSRHSPLHPCPQVLEHRRARVLLECTQTYFAGGNSGIQRVTRNLVNQSLKLGADSYPVVPVVWTGDGFSEVTAPIRIRSHYIYRIYGLIWRLRNQAHLPAVGASGHGSTESGSPLRPAPGTGALGSLRRLMRPVIRPFLIRYVRAHVGPGVSLRSDDILVLLDSTWGVPPMLEYAFSARDRLGFKVGAMIHDLFPLISPELCEKNTRHGYRHWFHRVLPHCDFAITNSECTKRSLLTYLADSPGIRSSALPCRAFPLGAELDTVKDRRKDHSVLDQIWSTPGQAILALGTIEPRKNHPCVLDAFDTLRARSLDVSLIVIGKPGWLSEHVLARLANHPDRGTRVLYLPDASDLVVANAFQRSDCLVCASLSEGFGLPLVEGLMYGCKVFASDIEAFREVGSSHCQYFSLEDPGDLPRQLEEWFRLQYSRERRQEPVEFAWPGWSESTRAFVSRVTELAGDAVRDRGPGRQGAPTAA